MNQGKYVFAQLMSLIDPNDFRRCVASYQVNYRVRQFTCWHQFLCLSFGQLTHRESLRDLVLCLQAHQSKLYYLGLTQGISRSTLADSNEQRDWRIYADFAQVLIPKASFIQGAKLDSAGISLDNPLYALDSTTIDLCLDVFWWAKFRKHKGAIKLHTLLDIRCQIPCFVYVTDGSVHDVNVLDLLEFEPGAFYIMARGYLDWTRLFIIHQANAFFVTRVKKNSAFTRQSSSPTDRSTGIICDQLVYLKSQNAINGYPQKLRRIKYQDKELGKTFIFITNHLEAKALEIALLYKNRWKIELFFKWIKQYLRIKVFWGETPNAVKIQIWVAVSTYVLVAILKEKLKPSQTMNEILQILSVSVFDKTLVNQLVMNCASQKSNDDSHNSLILF